PTLMKTAVVLFIHGLGGNSDSWGAFPRFLRENIEIDARYDIAEPYNYTTTALGAGPGIDQLALELATFLNSQRFPDYTSIILICHSMGGLIARRYIADQLIAGHRLRANRLLTFATPHLGSQLATTGAYVPAIGTQIKDLAVGSHFMNRLGLDWAATKA